MAVEPSQSDAPSDVQVFPPFTVTADSLGPIEHAEVTLKPLTVFIGPNGSGKTHMATLINGVMPGRARPRRPAGLPSEGRPFELLDDVRAPLMTRLLEGARADVPSDALRGVAKDGVRRLWLPDARRSLERAFGPGSVARDGNAGRPARARVRTPFFSCTVPMDPQVPDEDVEDVQVWPTAVTIYPAPEPQWAGEISERGDIIRLRGGLSGRMATEDAVREALMRAATAWLRNDMPAFLWHLPAARSGLVTLRGEIYRGLAAGAVDEVGLLPPYGGVVADYLSTMARVYLGVGPLAAVAHGYEQRLAGGKVRLDDGGIAGYAGIALQVGDQVLPPVRMSSASLEVAPVIVYLRHLVSPRDLFIIEEPEAHLHPDNQRLMARMLVRLVRAGVRVLITTHSEYLLSQLSNLVVFGGLGEERRASLAVNAPGREEEYLHHSEVAVYRFGRPDPDSGFVTHLEDVTCDEGISEEEFVDADHALNNERVAIENVLWGEDEG